MGHVLGSLVLVLLLSGGLVALLLAASGRRGLLARLVQGGRPISIDDVAALAGATALALAGVVLVAVLTALGEVGRGYALLLLAAFVLLVGLGVVHVLRRAAPDQA